VIILHIWCAIYPQYWSLTCDIRRIKALVFKLRERGLGPASGSRYYDYGWYLLSRPRGQEFFLIRLCMKIFNTLRPLHQVSLPIFNLRSQYSAFVFESQLPRCKLIDVFETFLWLSRYLPLKQQRWLALHRCDYFSAWRGRTSTKSFVACHSAPHHSKLLVAHIIIN
jgi:hypothetical protein